MPQEETQIQIHTNHTKSLLRATPDADTRDTYQNVTVDGDHVQLFLGVDTEDDNLFGQITRTMSVDQARDLAGQLFEMADEAESRQTDE